MKTTLLIRKSAIRLGVFLLLLAVASVGLAYERGEFQPFSKTVSTQPGLCSNDTSITVASGTTVYFCYSLFDPPPFDYEYNITDDILGFIAAGNATANEVTTEFAMDSVFVDTTNIGEFTVIGGNMTQLRGEVFVFNANATVLIGANDTPGFEYDAAIPTLSEVSMFVFGALLLLGAAVTFRRTSS